MQNQITRCGHVLDYLKWLLYNDWSVWKAHVLLVAVVLTGLHDTVKEHIEKRVIEMEEAAEKVVIIADKKEK